MNFVARQACPGGEREVMVVARGGQSFRLGQGIRSEADEIARILTESIAAATSAQS